MKKGLFTLLAIFAIAFQTRAQEITVEPVQMTLLTKKTATWCPPCGGWGWTTFENLLEANSEKAVVIAAHFSTSGDPLYTTTAEELIDGFEYYPGRPIFYTNTALISSTNGAEVEQTAMEFVNDAYAQSPVAQTGILATIDPTTEVLNIATKTEFFQKASGEYYLSTYLMDKEVIANQSGQGNNALHKNVLTNELASSTFGEVLVEGSVAVGATFEKSYEIEVSEDMDMENMEFVTIIWKKNGEAFDFVNTYKSDEITEMVPSSVNHVFTAGEFNITPTIATNRVMVELVLDNNMDNLEIALFDMKGQKVQTIFQGNQALGAHRYEVERPTTTAGIYVVTLTVAGESFSKKVVFK